MAKVAESSRPGKLVKKSAADIQAYIKSTKFKRDATRAKAIGPDPSRADLKDIPEFAGFDPKLFRPVKEKITTRVDADVMQWLRRKKQYQTIINEVLRSLMISEVDAQGPAITAEEIKSGKVKVLKSGTEGAGARKGSKQFSPTKVRGSSKKKA